MNLKPHITSIVHKPIFVLLEFFLLFVGVPAIMYLLPLLPILPVLWMFAFLCHLVLIRDSRFDRSKLWRISAFSSGGPSVIFRFGIYASVLCALVYFFAPDLLFGLIKQKPMLWLLIIFLYPVLSVYPQELIFRTYFFHRYGRLFPRKWLLIAVNALLFGYMHIIFHNWIAVLLTVVGGLFFAVTYHRYHSTLLVSAEHALFGCLIFTIGLGRFFYIGGIPTISQTLRF